MIHSISILLISLFAADAVPSTSPAAQYALQQSAPPRVSAKAWAVADGKTGKVLWGSKESEPRAIASTTKKLFVAEMNRRAKELELTQTSFLDPNGLARNQASARDLAALAWTAMQNKLFQEYVRTRRHAYSVVGKDGQKREVTWTNTNKFLGEAGFDGVKTGTTNAAGACLVASGTKGGDRLIVVVLGASPSDARYDDSRALFNWAWQQRATAKPEG
jgi:D-alanyl-D-alanine carboxypeptidase